MRQFEKRSVGEDVHMDSSQIGDVIAPCSRPNRYLIDENRPEHALTVSGPRCKMKRHSEAAFGKRETNQTYDAALVALLAESSAE